MFRVFAVALVGQAALVAPEVVLESPAFSSAAATASSVCVYNDAAFVTHWHLQDADTGAESPETSSYPVWQVRCLNPSNMGNLQPGAHLVPVIHAVWGRTEKPTGTVRYVAPQTLMYDGVNVSQVTYVCKGTTLDFSCELGEPPLTVQNVTKDMGEFLFGFMKGLVMQSPFNDCIKDVEDVYKGVVQVVSFFESGINHKSPANILRGFELIAELLKEVVVAIKTCVKEAQTLAANIKTLGEALSGNVGAIIQTVVKEAVHIYNDRKELTNDCKAVVADWRAGDFEGSGLAVGDIVGVLIDGIVAKSNLVREEIVV